MLTSPSILASLDLPLVSALVTVGIAACVVVHRMDRREIRRLRAEVKRNRSTALEQQLRAFRAEVREYEVEGLMSGRLTGKN